MPRSAPNDQHSLPQQPGAHVDAGTAGKQKTVPRKTFRESIGQGSASGGHGQLEGTGGSGDPTIKYPVGPGRPQPLGKTGKFGTQDQVGKRPEHYEIDLTAYADEY